MYASVRLVRREVVVMTEALVVQLVVLYLPTLVLPWQLLA